MTTKPRTIARAADAVRRPTGPMTPTSVALQVEFIEDVRRRVAETIETQVYQSAGALIKAREIEGAALDPDFIVKEALILARGIRRIADAPRRIGEILRDLED